MPRTIFFSNTSNSRTPCSHYNSSVDVAYVQTPSHMSLSRTESEVAVYIFMSSDNLDGKEILVSSLDGKAVGDRQTLKTIMPTSYVSSEVIMLVVSLPTNYKRLLGDYATCWFFPSEFSELALNNKKSPPELAKEFRNTYMGNVVLIKKIFIPINDKGLHWYLVVIDLEDGNIWFLDCNPFPYRNKRCRLHAKKLAITIQEMLMDKTFYELTSYQCPAISDFNFIEPEGLSHNLTSFTDCGVLVAKWMMECISNDDYQSIEVNAESRMRLALDLVFDRYNQSRNETVNNAYHNFKQLSEGCDSSDDL